MLRIRFIFLFFLLLLPLTTMAQQYKRKTMGVPELEKVNRDDTLKTGQSIIYGTFIQKLGMSSGGYDQNISLVNLETHETFSLQVKAENKVAKENTFCNFIEPGIYAIVNYRYGKGRSLGGFTFVFQPIYRNISSENLRERMENGAVKEEDLSLFAFKVEKGTITYLGTWHFDNDIVFFSNSKVALDNTIRSEFKYIDFSKAQTNLPN